MLRKFLLALILITAVTFTVAMTEGIYDSGGNINPGVVSFYDDYGFVPMKGGTRDPDFLVMGDPVMGGEHRFPPKPDEFVCWVVKIDSQIPELVVETMFETVINFCTEDMDYIAASFEGYMHGTIEFRFVYRNLLIANPVHLTDNGYLYLDCKLAINMPIDSDTIIVWAQPLDSVSFMVDGVAIGSDELPESFQILELVFW